MNNGYYGATEAKACGVSPQTPKDMTAVDSVNSRLFSINGHAREHIVELQCLLDRAGFGEPAIAEKQDQANLSPPGFLATDAALNSLQGYMHQIGDLIKKLKKIA